MGTRRRKTNEDSLDLLLDTITNAFGGILLLAILLALLVQRETQQDDSPQQQVSAAEMVQMQQQLVSLNHQKQVLLDAIQSQASLNEAFVDVAAREAIGQLVNMGQKLEQKAELIKKQTSKISELDQKTKAIQDELKATAVLLEKLRGDVSDTEKELEGEKSRRTRTAVLPREQETDKAMSVIILTQNTFYVLDGNHGKIPFSVNQRDFEVVKSGEHAVRLFDGTQIRLKADGGQSIEPALLRRELQAFDKQRSFLTLVVLPDAFDSFHKVREACVELGYEHSIFPIERLPIFESQSSRRHSAQ